MSELGEKVKASIQRLKAFEPPEGYYLAFSGGKDSVVCKALLDMAGCKYDATYRITSVDPPELVQFIKEKHPDVKREYPRYSDGTVATMWNLIPKKLMPPTRILRYCCYVLKESGGDGRMTVTGVRWDESVSRHLNQGVAVVRSAKETPDGDEFHYGKNNRSVILTNDNDENRRFLEHCYRRHKTTVNPIVDWSNADVWQFIHGERASYCCVYDEGFHRLGCIGCPMATQHGREREFLRWPKYKAMYLRTFKKMIIERERKGLDGWSLRSGTTAQDVFRWWMEYDTLPGQIDLLEEYDDTI